MAPRKKPLAENSSSVPAAPPPQHQDIALLAYDYFAQRGYIDGLDLDDWLQAERELFAKDSEPLPAPPKPARRRKAAGASTVQ
jgi:hypothetical protein